MQSLRGSCHCGAVTFTARVPSGPVPVLDCNCSMCSKTGFLHVIVPHEDFTLASGADALVEYRFGTGAARHLFCTRCGIKSFYQPRSHPGAWSVNARCLENPPELAIEAFDGRDWEAAKAALDEDAGAG